MQRVGMNNVQSHTLFFPLDFMKKNHRGQTGALVSETLPSPALCLCAYLSYCLPKNTTPIYIWRTAKSSALSECPPSGFIKKVWETRNGILG